MQNNLFQWKPQVHKSKVCLGTTTENAWVSTLTQPKNISPDNSVLDKEQKGRPWVWEESTEVFRL